MEKLKNTTLSINFITESETFTIKEGTGIKVKIKNNSTYEGKITKVLKNLIIIDYFTHIYTDDILEFEILA